MPVLKPAARENLSSRVYRQLRKALMNGEYEAGRRISIAEITAATQTSATPVREALFRLISEGALEMQEAHSFRVPVLTPSQVGEILAIRLLLEGEAAAQAARKATDEEIQNLRKLNERFMRAFRNNDLVASSTLNRSFHFAILEMAKMPVLQSTIEIMWARMGAHIRKITRAQLRNDNLDLEHKHYPVIEALTKRSPRAARLAIQTDIKLSRLTNLPKDEWMSGA